MKTMTNGNVAVSFFTAGEDDAMQLAHRRTCHTAVSTLQKMESMNAVHGLGALKSTKKIGKVCEACVEGKSMNQPHTPREKSTSKVLELMHTDLCGPINPPGLNGEKYVQLLTDDFSGAMWVKSIKTKDEAAERYERKWYCTRRS